MSDAVEFLRRAGLAAADEDPPQRELTGGVSSEIWRVELRSGPVCVKRALPRLRVAQLWEAPVERNRYEQAWLAIAGEAAPGSAPRVLARGADLFAMECIDAPVWKGQLAKGIADERFAAAVGAKLAAIHKATAGKEAVRAAFATDAIFYAIRLEPYLVATAQKHADLKQRLLALVERTAATRECLVHGDVSPKNILVREAGPVFLDAECAWYGDPAFDLAFCLNHLLLKCVWVPQAKAAFMQCFSSLKDTYLKDSRLPGVELRTATLLPALLLARVDGKSPVEYLDQAKQQAVRRVARQMILDETRSLDKIRDAWLASLT